MKSYEHSQNATKFAEGVLDPSSTSQFVPPATFVRMVVLEVISDPNEGLDDNKIAFWSSTLGVSNIRYAKILPRNTIIAQPIRSDVPPMFLFPFFPSHLALPCKPGEFVWAMFEDPSNTAADMAYWFGKITEPHTIDDVNHTHGPRIHEPSLDVGTKDLHDSGGKPEVWNELRNGPVNLMGKTKTRATVATEYYVYGPLGASGSIGAEDAFEKLVTETDAAKITQYESVPRFRKRPGDVAIEGTNNSLIVLGTDRTGPVATYKGKVPEPSIPAGDVVGSAGSIDIVAGRGQTSDTGGVPVPTTSIVTASEGAKGKEIKKEISKSRDDLKAREGDPDLKNDRSRVLISQRTKVDKNFSIEKLSAEIKTGNAAIKDDPDGDAAVVIKTDKIRLIARSDVEILVTGYDPGKSVDGKSIKNEKTDPKHYAAIVIKSNGDIVFRPSATGYVLLGGDDADKGILCSDLPIKSANGIVNDPTPITTTMGGQFGGSKPIGPDSTSGALAPGQGKWASKVKVK
jgi:hypothetical protein